MAEITAADIRKLRELTGAGMSDVKKALVENNGDFEKARSWLREKGLAQVAKRAGRSASNGLVDSYLHKTDPALPPTIGVLLELRCETDFVAKTDQFKQLGRDIAQHIAAADPLYVTAEQIPNEVLEQEKKIYEAAAREEGKPEPALPKIVEGRLNGYVKSVVLLEQPWVRDGKITIRALLEQAGSALGEKIEIGRFARFNVKQA
ncbi:MULTISPECIES: translation elongation factor Ts [unclassified Frankia]|uniref:translation elongation factor Ts n=1 Tax=unclassified Frankia TaxID=2632575 RepID=UPI002AD2E21C|nr:MULTISPECIES: translation elongation factor Ts [unclassified Frankia]